MKNQFRYPIENVLLVFLVCYVFQYFIHVVGFSGIRSNSLIDLTVFIIAVAGYVWTFRRENVFCFELLFLIFGFLGMFFKPLILPLVINDINFHSINNTSFEE